MQVDAVQLEPALPEPLCEPRDPLALRPDRLLESAEVPVQRRRAHSLLDPRITGCVEVHHPNQTPRRIEDLIAPIQKLVERWDLQSVS